MNLVASAILRGMVGASSSADLSGVPGNKRSKDQAAGTSGEPIRAAFTGGDDARAALKGIGAEAGLKEKQGQGAQGCGFFRSRYAGADAVQISDAGRNAPSSAGVASAAQDPSTPAGKALTIKA